jgi:hypothetical protein
LGHYRPLAFLPWAQRAVAALAADILDLTETALPTPDSGKLRGIGVFGEVSKDMSQRSLFVKKRAWPER